MRRHGYRPTRSSQPLMPKPQEEVLQEEQTSGPTRPVDQPGVLWRMFEPT